MNLILRASLLLVLRVSACGPFGSLPSGNPAILRLPTVESRPLASRGPAGFVNPPASKACVGPRLFTSWGRKRGRNIAVDADPPRPILGVDASRLQRFHWSAIFVNRVAAAGLAIAPSVVPVVAPLFSPQKCLTWPQVVRRSRGGQTFVPDTAVVDDADHMFLARLRDEIRNLLRVERLDSYHAHDDRRWTDARASPARFLSDSFESTLKRRGELAFSVAEQGPPYSGPKKRHPLVLFYLFHNSHRPTLPPSPPFIAFICAPRQESRRLLEDLREATPPGSSYRPGVSRYHSVLKSLRNAPVRGSASISTAPTTTNSQDLLQGKSSTHGHGGTGGGSLAADLEEEGGKWSGAEGWTKGHVSRLLGEMRAAGVTPNNETYQCAIRCATDAAMLDIAVAAAAERLDAIE